MTTHLVWFRQDLRLHDNLALAAACRLPQFVCTRAGVVYRYTTPVGGA